VRGSKPDQIQSGGAGPRRFFRIAEADAQRASALLELPELLNTGGDSTALNEEQQAMKDYQRALREAQCGWDYLIYRAARTAADLQVLKQSTKSQIVLAYLHTKI
jgi:hypothetical protein